MITLKLEDEEAMSLMKLIGMEDINEKDEKNIAKIADILSDHLIESGAYDNADFD